MDRWEYKTFKVDVNGFFSAGNVDTDRFNNDLNHYGTHGWELVNAFDTNSHNGGSKFIVVIMKRRIAA
jgi:hypothetical protein